MQRTANKRCLGQNYKIIPQKKKEKRRKEKRKGKKREKERKEKREKRRGKEGKEKRKGGGRGRDGRGGGQRRSASHASVTGWIWKCRKMWDVCLSSSPSIHSLQPWTCLMRPMMIGMGRRRLSENFSRASALTHKHRGFFFSQKCLLCNNRMDFIYGI